MKRNSFLWIAATMVIASCASNEPAPTDSQNKTTHDQNLISLEEALQNAEEEFALVFGSQTRSGREVVSAERLTSKTRTSEEDFNGFYIINYDKGFAMLSADRRTTPVYAISDEGSLSLADTIDNKGLSWYINDFAMNSVHLPDLPVHPDTTIHKFEPPKPSQKTKTVICEPMLKSFLAQMHQDNPYNKLCPVINSVRPKVGSVPLAVGTAMAIHKWPTSFGGYSFNWNSMCNNATHDSWARLFELLGRKENLNASYGVNITIAPASNIVTTLNRMGYKNAAYAKFNKSTIDNELTKKHPVICGGTRTDNPIDHEWIIDGGYNISYANNIGEGSSYIYRYYYRCVWGNGSNGNGYFLFNSNSDRLGGTSYDDNENTTGTTTDYKNLHMVYGFIPNK